MKRKIYITESQFQRLLNERMSNELIDERAEEADKKPSEAQKEAGNYKMGHVSFAGFKISIENAKGSKRYWKDDKGNENYNVIKNHYGYFSNSLGHDGDHVDVFLGDNQDSDKVYVVDQNKKDGSFDESKVMLGFNSKQEAKDAYMANFTPDWKGFRCITGVSKKLFKKWLYNGRKQQKPFAEYVEVIKKKLTESQEEPFILHGDLTDRERDIQAKKEKKAASARKAAETRKRKKEEKKKAEETAFWKQQEERGYKGLFEQCVDAVLNEEMCAGLYNLYEEYNLYELLQEFFEDKNKGITEKQWKVIPKEPYWNALRGYMQYGEAFRTPDYLIDDWLQIVYYNTITLTYMTQLAGHSNGGFPYDDLMDFFYYDNEDEAPAMGDYMAWSELLENEGFYDWCKLPDGSDAWSDYGLEPLWKIITSIKDDSTKGEKLITINRCLDVAHCRGDLASMFIEGGSKTCSEISNT